MNQINKFFLLLALCLFLISHACSREPDFTFRLVHPYHDKLINVAQSKASVDDKQYELFIKGNENYWVDRKVELNIKDFREAKIMETVMYPPDMKMEQIEVTSPLPPHDACTVNLYLSASGQTKIQNLTENNIGRRLAIIYNNNLLMAPLILEKITEGSVSVSGVSYIEAQNLKAAINKSTK